MLHPVHQHAPPDDLVSAFQKSIRQDEKSVSNGHFRDWTFLRNEIQRLEFYHSLTKNLDEPSVTDFFHQLNPFSFDYVKRVLNMWSFISQSIGKREHCFLKFEGGFF